MKYRTQIIPLVESDMWLTLTRGETSVMLSMILNTRNDNFYGGAPLLSKFTNITIEGVRVILQKLVEKELLELIEKRPGRTDKYRIRFENIPSEVAILEREGASLDGISGKPVLPDRIIEKSIISGHSAAQTLQRTVPFDTNNAKAFFQNFIEELESKDLEILIDKMNRKLQNKL